MRLAQGLRIPVILLPVLALLTGCSTSFIPDPTPFPAQTSLKGITGNVHGGRQPIVGAQIYVLAAGTSGYGGNGLAASTSNASASLLASYTTGSFPTAQNTTGSSATNPLYNDYYVTTDANGDFALNGEYTCTAGTQVYLYSLGGQPSPGLTNTSTGLMAVLGQCPSTGTMAATTPYVLMNEVSTVAAAYALAGFATDALHVSSSGTTLAQTGIANAFANAANLYDISFAHGPLALTTTPAGNGAVPQSEINSIANSLAACVNSSGSSSTQCTTLFEDATSNGTTCSSLPCTYAPSDTATAAIYIAHYPNTNVTPIFNLAAAIGTPYVPKLTQTPTTFSIALQFTGGGLNTSNNYINGLAIDASGYAWVTNGSPKSVTELSSLGAILSPGNGYTTGGIDGSGNIAIDQSGNIWALNASSVSAITSSGTALANSPFTATGMSSGPSAISIDGTGQIWITNGGSGKLTKLSSSGAVLAGFSPGNNLTGVAVDGSGNVWVANAYYYSNYMQEYSNSGSLLQTINYQYPNTYGARNNAVDASGNVWTANYGDGTVSEVSNSGTIFSGANGFGSLSYPFSVSIDGAGNAWIGEHGGGTVELSPSGTTVLSLPTSFTNSIAADGSGNVWIANLTGGSVSEYLGVAVPVITPICAGLPSTLTSDGTSNLGTRP